MFDAELKNTGHVSGSKMVTFIMDQGSKTDAALKAMKALIASCTELFSTTVESSEEGETSSSYSNLTPHDMVEIQDAVVGGGNQHGEEEDEVEDITALTAPPVSATEVVDLHATVVSSTIGKETLDDGHVAEVTPPSLPMTFHMASRVPLAPPFAPEFTPGGPLSTPRAPEFQTGGLLAAPRTPDVTEAGYHVGMIPAPNAHKVQVAPPRAPFLATDRADRNERQKKNKGAKLKKRKNRE